VRSSTFVLCAVAVGAVVFGFSRLIGSEYYFFAGYVVLQYIVLATAWNILGGYTGYVNFGSAAFFAIGAYSSVALHKFQPAKWAPSLHGFEISLGFLDPLFPLPIPVLIVVGGVISGVVGLGMGYLTLRLRGAFFAIATLALAVVVQTLVTNWDYVGGSRGAYILRPASAPLVGSYIEYLFLIMLMLAVMAVATARAIEVSRLGYGFATIRDDELAAEASGVPTLRLKLIATTLSGAFMGMAGAPLPYYVTYLDPASGFSLAYAVNSIAMPLVGGTTTWIGPVVGAILLGTIQQVATVTISSAVNLLLVGLILIAFVIIAPNGLVGLVQEFQRAAAPSRVDARSVGLIMVAIYAFLVGLIGIVLCVPFISAGVHPATTIGLSVLVLSVLYAAASYGLLKLQPWGLWLAVGVFAVSIPAAAMQMMDGTWQITATVALAVSAIALLYLLGTNVRLLYQRKRM
jgi:branched-chain amino acid transport system permease protein